MISKIGQSVGVKNSTYQNNSNISFGATYRDILDIAQGFNFRNRERGLLIRAAERCKQIGAQQDEPLKLVLGKGNPSPNESVSRFDSWLNSELIEYMEPSNSYSEYFPIGYFLKKIFAKTRVQDADFLVIGKE